MKKSNRLKFYYQLFMLIVENPRIMPKGIARYFKYSGRGRAPSTLMFHLQSMYNKQISFMPRLALRAYNSTQKTTYWCKKQESSGLYRFCKKLENDPRITYSLCFSSCDFFLISKTDDLNVEKLGLTLKEKSRLYTPQYTIPENWNLSFSDCLEEFSKSSFAAGKLDRLIHEDPPWNDLDWRIFHSMKSNIREKFTVVARKAESTSITVKKRFFKNILPNCIVAHYFFPKGYNFYSPAFLRLKTDHEVSIIQALRKLPSTTYVFPLEDSISLVLYYDLDSAIVHLMELLEKMEEMAIINSYLLYSPIVYTQ